MISSWGRKIGVQHRMFGGEARREDRTVGNAFELGQDLFEPLARRIIGARIIEAQIDAGTLLLVGRGLIDRRDERAGCRVARLSGMNRAGCETHFRFHGFQGFQGFQVVKACGRLRTRCDGCSKVFRSPCRYHDGSACRRAANGNCRSRDPRPVQPAGQLQRRERRQRRLPAGLPGTSREQTREWPVTRERPGERGPRGRS